MKQQISGSKIDNRSKGRYSGKREQTKNAAKKAKIRLAAVLLSVGIVGGIGAGTSKAISHMADTANHVESTREAIIMANTYNKYIEHIRTNPNIQDIITAENISKLEKFSKAVTTYKQLQYKQGKSLQEEQDYLDACKIICESKDLVIDNYTNVIKGKVANAYGITDPEEIESIEIRDYVDVGEKQEVTHNVMIKLPNGTIINNNGNFFNSTNAMDKKLAETIIEARALLNARYSFENQKLEDLPMNRIISTSEKAIDFEMGYKLLVKANGNLETIKVEQTKEQVEEMEQEER